MGENSAISWTDHTFNPWHGCTKIANPAGSGCDHCYAETQSVRYGLDIWGKDKSRRLLSDANWRKPVKWNCDAEAAGKPAFVFCASMGDVFEDRRDLDEPRERLWQLIDVTPWLVWLLLTKRPEQMTRLAPAEWADGWPSNVWAGCSVEHQAAAYLRIPRLLDVPARRRFLSVEPLLGAVDLTPWLTPHPFVDWVIVGGESGAQRRDMGMLAFADVVNDCRQARVPVWTKQDSGQHAGRQGRIPDALWRHERPAPVGLTAARNEGT